MPLSSLIRTSSSLMPGDVVGVPGEGRPEHGGDADRVLVDVRLDVLRADRVLVLAAAGRSAARRRSSGRTSPRRRARRRRRPGSGLSVGFSAASRRSRHFHFSARAPSMIASDEPWVRAPVVSPGGVEEVGEHADAALLDLRGLRVLGVVDEVAVEVVGDQQLRLGLHPGGDEGGEVALGSPSSSSSCSISRCASTGSIGAVGELVVRRRLAVTQRDAALDDFLLVGILLPLRHGRDTTLRGRSAAMTASENPPPEPPQNGSVDSLVQATGRASRPWLAPAGGELGESRGALALTGRLIAVWIGRSTARPRRAPQSACSTTRPRSGSGTRSWRATRRRSSSSGSPTRPRSGRRSRARGSACSRICGAGFAERGTAGRHRAREGRQGLLRRPQRDRRPDLRRFLQPAARAGDRRRRRLRLAAPDHRGDRGPDQRSSRRGPPCRSGRHRARLSSPGPDRLHLPGDLLVGRRAHAGYVLCRDPDALRGRRAGQARAGAPPSDLAADLRASRCCSDSGASSSSASDAAGPTAGPTRSSATPIRSSTRTWSSAQRPGCRRPRG